MSNATISINVDETPHYKYEEDINEIKKELKELREAIEELAGEIYARTFQ